MQRASKAPAMILVQCSGSATADAQPTVKVWDDLLQLNFQTLSAASEVKCMTLCDGSLWAGVGTTGSAAIWFFFGTCILSAVLELSQQRSRVNRHCCISGLANIIRIFFWLGNRFEIRGSSSLRFLSKQC